MIDSRRPSSLKNSISYRRWIREANELINKTLPWPTFINLKIINRKWNPKLKVSKTSTMMKKESLSGMYRAAVRKRRMNKMMKMRIKSRFTTKKMMMKIMCGIN